MAPRLPRSGAREILARARVDLHTLAGVDEERHLHHETRLERRRLARARHPIALDAGLGHRDLELDRGRQVDADDLLVVHREDRGVAFLQVVDGRADRVARDVQLVVGLVVHEDVVVAFAVEELHLALVDDRERHLLVGSERPVDDCAGAVVLQRRAYERAALTRLDVLEVDDGHQTFGQIERPAALQVVGRDAHSTRSLGVRVSGSQPPGVTTTVSSMRTPPMPGRYTPGSTVTTSLTSKVSRAVDDTRGASWISRPTP